MRRMPFPHTTALGTRAQVAAPLPFEMDSLDQRLLRSTLSEPGLLAVTRTVVVAALLGLMTEVGLRAAPDFTRDVRPILEQHCYECHGPEKQKSGYRLDV